MGYDNGYLDDDIRVRFESVIEFPYFLIHTLKVYIAIKGISHENAGSKIIDELLDDKKLIESFNRVTTYGVNDKGRIADNKENFSREFIICLLRTRFLFDKYIVKREYANENADREWSLKSLYVFRPAIQKETILSEYLVYSKGSRNKEKRSNDRNKRNIMLQSALRVSYTSPKVMHWITQLLIWLSKDNYSNALSNNLSEFSDAIEEIAKNAVREQFFDVCEDGVYAMEKILLILYLIIWITFCGCPSLKSTMTLHLNLEIQWNIGIHRIHQKELSNRGRMEWINLETSVLFRET